MFRHPFIRLGGQMVADGLTQAKKKTLVKWDTREHFASNNINCRGFNTCVAGAETILHYAGVFKDIMFIPFRRG